MQPWIYGNWRHNLNNSGFGVGAFALIFDDDQSVLLCHRRDIDAWNLPGGEVESGELPNEAVVREVQEETGLQVIIDRLVGVYRRIPKNIIVFSFICRIVGGEIILTDESDETKYFHVDDLPVNTSPAHVERIYDALKSTDTVYRHQAVKSTREYLEELVSN